LNNLYIKATKEEIRVSKNIGATKVTLLLLALRGREVKKQISTLSKSKANQYFFPRKIKQHGFMCAM